MLARLRGEGILLAAVSRNDADTVLPPFRAGRMVLREGDFVAIIASYHAKSAQIAALAQQLNLGLDAFVYVDDNPVELAEIGTALPQVTTLAFPTREEELPGFLRQLSALFVRETVTPEDRERTELYRRRAHGIAPSAAQGADLTQFLAGLEMRLVLHDRSQGDRARAVQLINKTNQFNANGRRWADEEVAAILTRGGRLFTASLLDRTGSHGEILACLIGPDQTIEALVMSCRVFQRRVEYAFFSALGAREVWPAAVRSLPTERNEPFRQFLADPAFGNGSNDMRSFDGRDFARRHQDALRLFEVTWG
jgi:FkbH-like protein